MSAARLRAISPSSGSIISDFAAGVSRERSSAINTAMRSSSAGMSVFGSGGAGRNASSMLAHPAHVKRRSARTTERMLLQDLEQAGCTHTASDAHGHDAELCLAPATLDQEVSRHARAGHAVRMPDRNCAAVDVHLGRIDFQLVGAIEHLAGK